MTVKDKKPDKTDKADPKGAIPLNPTEVRKYQLTSLDGNSNKFYDVYLYGTDYSRQMVIHHGRVGSRGSVHDYGMVSEYEVDEKVREKLRKGYRPVRLHGSGAAQSIGIDLSTPEGRLADLIYSEAGEAISHYLATSVDNLASDQIMEGRRVLAQVRNFSTYKSLDIHDVGRLVEEYFNAIPTKLPPKINKSDLVTEFVQAEALDEQENRLNQLEAAISTSAGTTSGLTQLEALGAEVRCEPAGSLSHLSIRKLVEGTAKHGYRMEVQDIYSVEIPAEREAYKAEPAGKRRKELLYHGSANQNIRHILRSGLIIRRTAASGRMLGDGIYFANMASKSGNYCNASRHGLPNMLLVSEVALGSIYEAPDIQHYTRPPAGYDSVKGVGGKTRMGYGSTLQNDEFVVYKPSQATIRFVVTWRRG